VSLLHVLWGQRTLLPGRAARTGALHGGRRPATGLAGQRNWRGWSAGASRWRARAAKAWFKDQPRGRIPGAGAAHGRFWSRTDRAALPCRAAIVAMPRDGRSPLHFMPELPADRLELTAGDGDGRLRQNAGGYTSPWWRKLGALGKSPSVDRPWVNSAPTVPIPKSGWGVPGRLRGGPSLTQRWVKAGRSGAEAAVCSAIWLLSGACRP